MSTTLPKVTSFRAERKLLFKFQQRFTMRGSKEEKQDDTDNEETVFEEEPESTSTPLNLLRTKLEGEEHLQREYKARLAFRRKKLGALRKGLSQGRRRNIMLPEPLEEERERARAQKACFLGLSNFELDGLQREKKNNREN